MSVGIDAHSNKTQAPTETQAAAELIAQAEAMIPTLRARGHGDEENRRVSKETIAEFQEAGLLKLLQPKIWGGQEVDPSVFAEVHMALARGDMSAAWVFSVFCGHAYHLSLFDRRAQADVWTDNESALIASSYAPTAMARPVDGGYRLSGRWKFSSGSDHADWFLFGALTEGNPKDHRIHLVRREGCKVRDTWRVMGLKATGSQDVIVDDVFVPDYATLSHVENMVEKLPGHEINHGPLYVVPNIQIFFRSITTGCIGGLEAMLEEFLEYGATKTDKRGRALIDNPDAQLACAQAAAGLEEMKATLHRNLNQMMSLAQEGRRPEVKERLLYRYQASEVPGRCVHLARELFKVLGGSAIYDEDFPFGRICRNLEAAEAHPTGNSRSCGRSLGVFLLTGQNDDPMI